MLAAGSLFFSSLEFRYLCRFDLKSTAWCFLSSKRAMDTWFESEMTVHTHFIVTCRCWSVRNEWHLDDRSIFKSSRQWNDVEVKSSFGILFTLWFSVGSVYWPDCPIWDVLGWVPCVQITFHWKCIRLRAFKSPYINACRVNSNTLLF